MWRCWYLLAQALVAAQGSYAIDLGAFRIESAPKPNAKAPPGFEVRTNSVALAGLEQAILLGQSATNEHSSGTQLQRIGFDVSTLRLEWLIKERLLWVSWRTVPQGQGRYWNEGHVVVMIEGTEQREVFRDSIYGHGCAGMGNCTTRSLEVSYDRGAQVLTIVVTDVSTTPDCVPIRCKGAPCQEGGVDTGRTRERWRYTLGSRTIHFASGDRAIEFEGVCRVADIASHLKVSRRDLERLNKWRRGQNETEGMILVSDRAVAYKPEHESAWPE